MRIEHEDKDALEIIKDIHTEMAKIRDLISALEYVIYQKDERVEINFFEDGVRDSR